MIPERDTLEWLFDATAWWLENFGGFDLLQKTPLFLPNAEFYAIDPRLRDEELAEAYFDQTALNAGFSEWPFVLEELSSPDVSKLVAGLPHNLMSMNARSAESGSGVSDGYPVGYELTQLSNPIGLVATFARNISHYHLYEAQTPLPSEEEHRPYFVDLGAVLLGFGVFLTNSAFEFSQYTDGLMIGWGVSRQGALSELDMSYALALFLALRETKPRPILKLLKSNPKGFVKSALKDIRKKRSAQLERLRGIAAQGGGPYR